MSSGFNIPRAITIDISRAQTSDLRNIITDLRSQAVYDSKGKLGA